MQTIVKQLSNDDGDPIEKEKQTWHAIHVISGDRAMICTGEFIDLGAGDGTYEIKQSTRGIKCKSCISQIKYYKSIKL